MPARSGPRPEEDAWRSLEPLRPAREYGFVRPNDELWLTSLANTITVGTFTAVPIGWIEILPLWGGPPVYRRIVNANATANRTADSAGPLLIDTTGWIVDGGVTLDNFTATAFKRGMLFSSLRIRRPADDRHWTTLCADYLVGDRPNVPIGRIQDGGPGGGEGLIRQITKADPAIEVDAGLIDTVPTNAVWKVLSIRADLATSADVGARYPRFQYRNATDVVVAESGGRNTQPASETREYAGAIGTPNIVESDAAITQQFALPDMILDEAFDVFISTTGFDAVAAGDNWGAIQMMVEEWPKL